MAHLRCDFRSEVLDMGTSMTVFLPESIDCSKVKVVYLLHGITDNCTGWSRYTRVEFYARKYGVGVVIPEVQRSYYTDMKYGLKYYSFISEELPRICSRFFGFSAEREKNYIMGLSMGGYGALKCALRNPLHYAGCGVFSVADVEMTLSDLCSEDSEFIAIFGGCKCPESDNILSLVSCANKSNLPVFYITCGTEDIRLPFSTKIATGLDRKGAIVEFEKWTGSHDWDFWEDSVRKAFSFFFEERCGERE